MTLQVMMNDMLNVGIIVLLLVGCHLWDSRRI